MFSQSITSNCVELEDELHRTVVHKHVFGEHNVRILFTNGGDNVTPEHAVFKDVGLTLGGLPQVMWPAHCVQGTRGLQASRRPPRRRVEHVFRKGTDPGIDGYLDFFDNGHQKATGLGDWLKARGVTEVVTLGLATDYCVKFTTLVAIGLGFRATLVEDGCRAVNLQAGDGDAAIAAMRSRPERRSCANSFG